MPCAHWCIVADDDLAVGLRHVVPAAELDWKFSTSGGPGGQHANRSNTRAELKFDLASSHSFSEQERSLMLDQIRHADGVVTVVVDESRSQFRNRQLARKRLAEMLLASMIRPTPRRRTKPSRGQRQARLNQKRRTSEKKSLRKRPDYDK